MPSVKNYQQEMNNHIDGIVNRVKQLSDDEIHYKPAEDVWSVIEIIGHVEEVITYWTKELIRVIQDPDTSWGRGLQDEARLSAVANAPKRQVADILEGIEKARNDANDRWSEVSDKDLELQAPHRNPKFGVKPMSFLVEHFITDHLKNHLGQIERNLKELKSSN
ncbi:MULTISPECIES: DinB family protein [Bacillaceae]|uniref:DinB family protein n=1 Tax=Evansella alkalicola TaxID=745819 RepID=A0ABS6JXS0_9BACI|nr:MULTISPECIES: DinB family protein [Bacillaceae]MBU9723190.1 DinB family protein [Bacillus alkalicola]